MWFSRIEPSLRVSKSFDDCSSAIFTRLGQHTMVTMSLPTCPVRTRTRILINCIEFSKDRSGTALGADSAVQPVQVILEVADVSMMSIENTALNANCVFHTCGNLVVLLRSSYQRVCHVRKIPGSSNVNGIFFGGARMQRGKEKNPSQGPKR